jgi:ABC-type glycerol-3-phosphate transport system substrate-binding protein
VLPKRAGLRSSRRAVLAALTPVLPAALAACGGTGSGSETAPGAPGRSKAGRVELWQLYANSPAAAPLKALIQRKHPDIQLEWVDVNGGEQPAKLTVATAAGTPPDVTSANAPFFGDLSRFHRPLDDYLKRDARREDVDDWLPIWRQASTRKGQTLGLPLEVAVRGWWFNKNLLTEKGVPLPTRAGAPATVDYRELETLAARLTYSRGDAQVYGLYVARNWWEVLVYVYGFGGAFLDADHTRCLLDTPQAIAGLEYANDLVVKRQLAPAEGAIETFEQEGTVAMYLHNAARAQNLRRLPQGTQWDTGPVVRGPGAPMSFAFIHQVGVVRESRNPEGAWAIATEYTGKDANPFWMEHHGWPTARKSYLDAYTKEGSPPPDTRLNLLEWIKAAPVVTFPTGYTANVAPIANPIVTDLMRGQRTARDAAAALAREITAVLER